MLNPTLVSLPDEDICLLFKPSNQKLTYMCDCGYSSGLSVKDCRDLGGLFLTHLHIDHFNHFDAIMRHQLDVGRTIVITGPSGVAQQISKRLQSYTWNLSFDDQAVVYEVREIEGENRYSVYRLEVPTWEPLLIESVETSTSVVFESKQFSAQYTILDHGTASVAYRFQEPSVLKIGAFEQRPGPWISALKKAYLSAQPQAVIDLHGESVEAGTLFDLLFMEQGDSLGFAMDHGATAQNHELMLALFDQVKTLFIECYYHDDDEGLAIQNHHSIASKSGWIAGTVGAKDAIPCHFSRRYNDRLGEVRDLFHDAYKKACSELGKGA